MLQGVREDNNLFCAVAAHPAAARASGILTLSIEKKSGEGGERKDRQDVQPEKESDQREDGDKDGLPVTEYRLSEGQARIEHDGDRDCRKALEERLSQPERSGPEVYS